MIYYRYLFDYIFFSMATKNVQEVSGSVIQDHGSVVWITSEIFMDPEHWKAPFFTQKKHLLTSRHFMYHIKYDSVCVPAHKKPHTLTRFLYNFTMFNFPISVESLTYNVFSSNAVF